jgi:hypothetical protein
MKLQNRIEILRKLRDYLINNSEEWQQVKHTASIHNGWFTPSFIDLSINNIIERYLDENDLHAWIKDYSIIDPSSPKNIGIVMAGNIPMVGFHDFLSVFISGHYQTIKLSEKDNQLLKHLLLKMYEWDSKMKEYAQFASLLKGCDAYIATGSNNSARYFEQYFAKYPSIIRKNRTSIAILDGTETNEYLEKLSDDIHLFFGLGCRNVTKIYVPEEYNFIPLLQSFHQYKYFADHHKYKNNYDYNLSIQLMNNRYYMTNESTLLVENDSLFSPISQLNYSFYNNKESVIENLKIQEDVQCIVGLDIPFGMAQKPGLKDYADGIDTLDFLSKL